MEKVAFFNKALIEFSPVFIIAISTDGKTLMMNRSMLNKLGYSEEEVLGNDYLTMFIPEEEREPIIKHFHKLIKLQGPARVGRRRQNLKTHSQK
ncbi:MAG: PAS domain S-box protein [Deltaproteobacteria bacterium]|nr:PAS domain S-box protein [Deltaproteobacteria bacterium]